MLIETIRYLARATKCRYRDHRVELDALLAALRPGDVAVDIGANKGAFLLALARRVGREGRVLALEPQPSLAEGLRRLMRSLRLPQVEVLELAASDRAGSFAMHVPPRGTSPGATLVGGSHVPADWITREVRTQPLDEILVAKAEGRRIGAIKIDVEGHEPAALRGAEETILRHRPTIVFECEERHLGAIRGEKADESSGIAKDGERARSNRVPEAGHGVRGVVAWLSERGYAVKLVTPRGPIDAADYRPEVHQRRDGERFWDAPEYCNNFVATPR